QPGSHARAQARVVLPPKRDLRRGADGAVEPVATDEPPGPDLFRPAVRAAEGRGDRVAPVPERDQLPPALDADTGRLDVPQEDALRVALGQAQLGGEGAIDAFDLE